MEPKVKWKTIRNGSHVLEFTDKDFKFTLTNTMEDLNK